MPQPTSSDVLVSLPLTQISTAYIQDATNFVADVVFPTVPVERQSALYATYDKTYWFRSQAKVRNPGAESAGSGYGVNFKNAYVANEWALHIDIDDQTRANTVPPVDPDRDGTEYVTQQMLLAREYVWATSYFGIGIWGANYAGNSSASAMGSGTFMEWDLASSTPVEDITFAARAIQGITGRRPNVLVLAPDVFYALSNHPEIQDRIKYTQLGVVTEDLLAALFKVPKVLVAQAVIDTSAEQQPYAGNQGGGDATDTVGFMMSNGALLAYAAPSPSIMQPSAGYIFAWTGLLGSGPAGNRIMSYRMEERHSDRIDGSIAFAAQVVGTDLGAFFTSCLSVA